jgi:RecJ-like exonuclease
MSDWSKESVEEVVEKVCAKAAKDEKFRALCISNIQAAIKEVSGKEVPSNLKINVVDTTGYHMNVTLPPLQKADGELKDSELESVAGGKSPGSDPRGHVTFNGKNY